MLNKALLIQAPSKFYEAVPFFYREAQGFGFINTFYVVTDYKEPYNLGDNCVVKSLKKDLQFSSNMLNLLSLVQEDVFFICCEDHVLKGPNNKDEWQQCWDFVDAKKDCGYLRMTNNGRVEYETKGDKFSLMSRKYKYYASLQPGIWRRDYFKEALKKGEDAWQFEIKGSQRVRKHPMRSYCVNETIFHHTNFYKSGKFYRHKFAEYAIKNGFELTSGRKVFWKGKTYSFKDYKDNFEKREANKV